MAQVWGVPKQPPCSLGGAAAVPSHTRAPLRNPSWTRVPLGGAPSHTLHMPEVCSELLPARQGHLPPFCAGRHALEQVKY